LNWSNPFFSDDPTDRFRFVSAFANAVTSRDTDLVELFADTESNVLPVGGALAIASFDSVQPDRADATVSEPLRW
jgi:hypothetical protein